ncbi:hypothetical protein V8F33_012864 [Rhypophila sp. PSN 637]
MAGFRRLLPVCTICGTCFFVTHLPLLLPLATWKPKPHKQNSGVDLTITGKIRVVWVVLWIYKPFAPSSAVIVCDKDTGSIRRLAGADTAVP